MRLSNDVLYHIFKEVRISIREITIFNPLDYRPNFKHPLTFRVKYQIQGRPPLEDGKIGRLQVMKEAEEIINISFLDLNDSDYKNLASLAYSLKTLFTERIGNHEGINLEKSNDDLVRHKQED